MSDSVNLLPPQKWLHSLSALAETAAPEIRGWLRHGINVWSSNSKPADRLEAFAPILLNPREPGPIQLLGAVSDMMSETGRVEFRWQLESALEQEIAAWSYTDGVAAGVFLLELAGWFGCRQLESVLRTLMARPIHLGPTGRTELATALGFVVCRRTSQDIALSLARRMIGCGLGPQPVIAQIVAFVAASNPLKLPGILAEFLPGWQMDGYYNDSCRLLADHLVDRVGLSELAVLILSGDPRFDNLSVLLQAHRIELGELKGDTIEIVDKLGGRIALRAPGVGIERAREVVRHSAFEQFGRNPIGELVQESELTRIGSDDP